MKYSLERTLIIRNTASSDADKVQSEVVDRLQENLPSSSIHEFWTPSANRDITTEAIAEAIQPGDNIIVAAGDGTSNAVVNAYIQADVEGTKIGFLPYGNFNDMAATFTDTKTRRNPALLLADSTQQVEVNPLEVSINGEHYRYAMLYATLGWTARVASLFDHPEARKGLQQGKANLAASLFDIANMYFKTRKAASLPPFNRTGGPNTHELTTDILAINGPIMAKIIQGQEPFYAGGEFLSKDLDVSGFFKNANFLGRSGINFALNTHFKLPGTTVTSDLLTFDGASLPVQLDGEFFQLETVDQLAISKDQSGSARKITILKTSRS
jgi:hypothetical protein